MPDILAAVRSKRRLAALVAMATAVAALAIGWNAWADTTAAPDIRRSSVTLADMPTGATPLTVALISDIHVAGPDMTPARLRGIVARINALGPDAVLIAGDLVSDRMLSTHHYTPAEIVAPLGALDAPLGIFAVLGNHDHWFDPAALTREMEARGITVLSNDAIAAGPLVIGGLDDDYTDHADIPSTLAAMDALGGGARIVLSHTPDPLPDLPEGTLILAGHTHCGQIQLPLVGMVFTQSRYGDRFACGRTDEGTRTAIVGAGLGTSALPIRFGTRPEIWLVELRGPGD